MIDPGLDSRVVLVTGANHGIGAATAKAFAAQRARVFINYLRLSPEDYGISPEEASRATTPGRAFYLARQAISADEVVQEIRDKGGQVEAWEADLADSANIPRLFDRVEETFGPVDVLVNNAAHCQPETFIPASQLESGATDAVGAAVSTITAEGHDHHSAVNSRAVALMMAEYAKRYLERGGCEGRIVNVSTDAASCHSRNISYAASKHALDSYSRSAAAELGPYGITVNIVSPGPVQTGYITAEVEERVSRSTPLGRVGQPEDVADVIVLLASRQARWVTGQLIYVGGGWRMHL